jgi:integrase/recombinase XerD
MEGDMRTVEVTTADLKTRYVVVDDDGELVAPIVRYLKHLDVTGKARNTLRVYALMLALYFEYLGQADLDWQHPTLDGMAGFVTWLKSPYRSTKVHPVRSTYHVRSNRTINLALTAASSFYDYMRRTGDVYEDMRDRTTAYLPERTRRYKGVLYGIAADGPVEKNILKQPVSRTARPRTISKGQVQAVMDACENRRDHLLIWLLYETGMRIGEALALWVQDVDVADCVIRVRDRGELENGAEIKTPRSERDIHVSAALVDAVVSYVGWAHTVEVETNHLFLTRQGHRAGRPLVYRNVQSLFRRLARKTGLPLSPHVLRHSILTELARQGWRPELLQERAGHASFQHTYQLYVHPTREDVRREWERTQDAVRLAPENGAEVRA